MRILFTGYAPVHFVCFQPLYRRLVASPGVEVYVSGGIRTPVAVPLDTSRNAPANESGALDRARAAAAASALGTIDSLSPPGHLTPEQASEGPAGSPQQLYEYDEEALYDRFEIPRERVLSVAEIAEREFDVLFGANTQLIAPAHADVKIQIFHGISFRNKAIRDENLGADYYFVVGPYMLRRFTEAGLFSHDDPRAVKVGFMKTDALLDGSLDRRTLLDEYGFDGTRPVVLYAPTGAKRNSLETMGYEAIDRLVRSGKFDLLVKPHDHAKNRVDWFERLAHFDGPHCRMIRSPDVVPPMFVSDLLISDASSVSSEYSLLDRPMLFLDVPGLLKASLKGEATMLDLETWGRRCGTVVAEPIDLPSAVERALAHRDEHSSVRRAMAKDLFYNPGRAGKAAFEWLSQRVLSSTRPSALRA
jgi:hypothetical protein